MSVPTKGRGAGRRRSIIWVKTETSALAGSATARIAGPTISIVSPVVPMMMMRLVNAFRLRSAALPSYAATRLAKISIPVIRARIRA